MGKKKIKAEVEADTYLRKLITAEVEECAKENSIDINAEETARTVEAALDLIEAPIYLLLENIVAEVLDRVVNGELPEAEAESDDEEEEDEGDEEEEEEEGDDDVEDAA